MAKICLQCRYFYHGHGKKPSLCTNRHSEKFPDKLRHDGHSPVCRHFRPPKHHHPPGLLAQYKGKLKSIENLRDKFAGQEIWVLASGPSLEDIPDDFLTTPESKISIAVKEAGIVFPDCTYNIWPFRAREVQTYLGKGILPKVNERIPWEKFIFTLRKSDVNNWLGSQCTLPTYMRYTKGGTIERLGGMCASIVEKKPCMYWGVGTIAHLAIAAAAIMGASKISLVGCEHGVTGDKDYAQSRGMSGFSGFQNKNVGPYHGVWMDGYVLMRTGTNFLANFFKDHGVEIVRYYHGRGYERVGETKEESESDEVMQ